jgi:hypothetical protein
MENEIAKLTALIASFLDSPAEALLFRDAFCEDCPNGHEIINGTAAELAQKILDLGWGIDPLRDDYLNCPTCLAYEPPITPIMALEEHRYAAWKGDR